MGFVKRRVLLITKCRHIIFDDKALTDLLILIDWNRIACFVFITQKQHHSVIECMLIEIFDYSLKVLQLNLNWTVMIGATLLMVYVCKCGSLRQRRRQRWGSKGARPCTILRK